MDAGKVFGRGISFPPRIGADGRMVWSEGERNVREAIEVILMTNPLERVTLPQFGGGLGPLLFEPNTVTTRQLIRDRMTKALAQWEPRIVVESIAVEADPNDPQGAIATVTYKLRATQTRERVSVNVTLVG